MKKTYTTFIVISILILSVFQSGFALEKQDNEATKSYLIAFKNGIDTEIIKQKKGKVKKSFKILPVVAADLSASAVQELRKNPNVSLIEEDQKVYAAGQIIPWGITKVRAPEAQQIGCTGSGVKVAVFDTGISTTHEDIHLSGGANFVQNAVDYSDDNGHGTQVAGIISATNNNVGVLGVSPNAQIYSVKVLDKYGSGNFSDIIAGIEWAINNKVNIINMSFGGDTYSQIFQNSLDKAYNSGILLIASAGNNGFNKKGSITYPAAYQSVIAVGAVDLQNKRADFSSVGRDLELVAPGVGIQSTFTNGYGYYSGTSFASPHVSGVAALVWETRSELTNIQLRNILNKSANSIGDSFNYGYGIVNVMSALKYPIITKK